VGDPVTSSALPSRDIDSLIFEPEVVLSSRPPHELGFSACELHKALAVVTIRALEILTYLVSQIPEIASEK
jgi:hypothetical protein